MWALLTESKGFLRILIIIIVAAGAHLLVMVTRHLGNRILSHRYTSAFSMARTVLSFLISTLVFVMYFVALGLILKEFGISLTAYFGRLNRVIDPLTY